MEGVDRINELRDEILVNNIMSRLDCTTKELIRTTATISKRWKNLWTQLPHLIFSNRDDHTYFGNDDTVSELDYSIDAGISDDTTYKEMLRGLLESLHHVKDVIINDFWWEFYVDLKARGGIANGPDKLTLSSGGTSAIKASCVKEVDRMEKQFDDSTPNLFFGFVSLLIE
nr:hypothetical protein [Tanacetum cinerariifolium]